MIAAILAAILTARLDNGMTVVVAPDPHVSDAAVELWFRAGSSDEPPRQHGIAHLFEHTLPSPQHVLGNSENLNAIRRDSLDSNGSTGTDYTNFFMRVPAASVELPIAIFADRMSAAADAITDATLAKNREIVEAEFRNASGRRWDPALTDPIRRVLFGPGHPYGHAVLGTTADVDAVTVAEMRQWFHDHYGAANAMLVVAGNVDPEQIVGLARKHFGSIAAGEALPAVVPPVTPRRERTLLDLNVPQQKAALILAWRSPAWNAPERQDVMIAVDVLRDRLQRALHCDVVPADSFTGSAGGEMSLSLACGDPAAVLANLDDFLASSPAIVAARDGRIAALRESFSHLGWRDSRTQLAGEGLWFANDANAGRKLLARLQHATTASVMRAAKTWLRNPIVVRVAPAVLATAPDRTATINVPKPEPSPATDVVDALAGNVRLITASRALPAVFGRVIAGSDVEPVASLEELERLVHDRTPDVVVLVGNADRSAIERLLRALPPPRPRPPANAQAQSNVHETIAFPNADPARVALFANLLRSRLNATLREQERWTYNVDVHTEGPDTIVIESSVDTAVASRASAVVREAVETLLHEPLSAADASRAAGSELRRLQMLTSTAADLADALVDVANSGESYADYVRSHRELYDSLRAGAPLGLPSPIFRTPRPLS